MARNKRTFAIAAVSAFVISLTFISPIKADGNSESYFANADFQKLVSALSNTQTLILDSNKTTAIKMETTLFEIPSGANSELWVTNSTVGGNNYAESMTKQYWDDTNNVWGASELSQQIGFDDSKYWSYSQIKVAPGSVTKAALSRLHKPGATWAVERAYEAVDPLPDMDPYFARLRLAQSRLSSLAQITANATATISNLEVNSGMPAGSDTYTLRSDTKWDSHDLTFVVKDNVVTSAVDDWYSLQLDNTRTTENTRTVTTLEKFSSSDEVVSLMPNDAKTVNFTAYRNMFYRVSNEWYVTPAAKSIAAKARVLAKKSKGKAKKVVTAKLIQLAAKTLKIGARKTKTGIKLTAENGFLQPIKGSMCVSAIKKRAVVKHC